MITEIVVYYYLYELQHKIEMILFIVATSTVAKASNCVAVAVALAVTLNFANGNTATMSKGVFTLARFCTKLANLEMKKKYFF
jgi:hypothetical protein